MLTQLSFSTSGNGYTNAAWPTTNVSATLTLDYFDKCSIPNLPAKYILASRVSKLTRGLPTVKKTSVLNTPTDQLWDAIYYDDLGRSLKSFTQHYLGGTANLNNYDATTTTYNFTNQPTTTTRQHWNTTSTTVPLVTVANTFLYDQVGRKIKTWEQITNGGSSPTTKTLISKIDYNEIGQVLNKHLHSTDSTTFLQTIAYTYNERGWLVSSSAPLFAMALYYNTSAGNKAYNGNIMYQYWGTPGSLGTLYNYAYDKLNRLLYGVMELTPSGTILDAEQGLKYDQMGNITQLVRSSAGTTQIDNLAYTYTGNQLQSVYDNTGSNSGLVAGTTNYTWDGNGNMLRDTNSVNMQQNKTVTYNLLNLPQTIKVQHGMVTYTYDALGNKMRKVSVLSGITHTMDYIAGIEYDGGTTDTLNFIQTEEGKAAKFGSIYDYTYYLGDNLGNTRITFGTRTGSLVSYQTDDYYPFGMEINNSLTGTKNEYLYNKKELQEETQEYDYGARFYDPVIARWNTIDPLAEMSRRFSPYNYVENNPIRFMDPDGMETVTGAYGETHEVFSNEHWHDPGSSGLNDGGNKKTQKYNPKPSYPSQNAMNPVAAQSSTKNVPLHLAPMRPKSPLSDADQKLVDFVTKNGRTRTYINPFRLPHGDAINEIIPEKKTLEAALIIGTDGGSLEVEEGFEGLSQSRNLGQLGEEAAGISGPKTAIQIGGRTRFPDRLGDGFLDEVKNVKFQNFTRQLRDYYQYSQENGLQMRLFTRPGTQFSGPLQQLLNSGDIIHIRLKGL